MVENPKLRGFLHFVRNLEVFPFLMTPRKVLRFWIFDRRAHRKSPSWGVSIKVLYIHPPQPLGTFCLVFYHHFREVLVSQKFFQKIFEWKFRNREKKLKYWIIFNFFMKYTSIWKQNQMTNQTTKRWKNPN